MAALSISDWPPPLLLYIERDITNLILPVHDLEMCSLIVANM